MASASGMTAERFTIRSGRCGGAYPRCPARVARCACRCLRRDVDGPIHSSHVAAAGAWKESGCSRSRRPDCDRCRRGASNGGEAATAEEAHGRRVRKGRPAADLQREQKSPHAGAARQPGDLQGSRGARRGSREGLPRPSGPARTRPWVADEAPAYPSHPRPRHNSAAGDGRRVQQPLRGRTDEPAIKAASRPQATGALAEVMVDQVRKTDGRGNEAFTPIAAVSGARSLRGSHVPAQEGLPQGRGRYRGRRGGAGAPCGGTREVGRTVRVLRWQIPDSVAGGSASGMTDEFGCAMMAARRKRRGGAQ
jgi:hypothetical protein